MTKFFKIHINSRDLIRGSIMDGVYKIDLPIILEAQKQYMLDIESFATTSTDGYIHYEPFNIIIPSIVQGNTYSTTEDGPTRSIKTIAGNSFIQPITRDTLGTTLQHIDFLRMQELHIRFVDITHDVLSLNAFGSGGYWAMTLVIWEC